MAKSATLDDPRCVRIRSGGDSDDNDDNGDDECTAVASPTIVSAHFVDKTSLVTPISLLLLVMLHLPHPFNAPGGRAQVALTYSNHTCVSASCFPCFNRQNPFCSCDSYLDMVADLNHAALEQKRPLADIVGRCAKTCNSLLTALSSDMLMTKHIR